MTNSINFLLVVLVAVSLVLNLTVWQGTVYSHASLPFDKAKNLVDLEVRIEQLLLRLIKCESGGNPKAVNIDRDGTASWGILQFKPRTLRSFGIRYGFLPKNIGLNEVMKRIHDAELQIKVAREMIREYGHRKKFWKSQFPGCSKKMGLW